jgi:medium-chain acyl-[acyl-carrier-protein] hydrolase
MNISAEKVSRSFVSTYASPAASIRLFCFPYAGGSASAFREWGKSLFPQIEVLAAELPGHGYRITEPRFKRMEPLVRNLAQEILPHLDRQFVFFGHSMGAAVAFELSLRLRAERGLEPEHLFVSGRTAPHVPDRKPPTYALPEKEFVDELRRLNGTPREVLEHPELLGFVLPMLRADFELIQTYRYSSGPPLRCPMSAFVGSEDPDVSPQNVELWKEHTCGSFRMSVMLGDHFYLESQRTQVLRQIRTDLGCLDQPQV